MRIVLTGATGFIGTSLLKRLLGAGHDLVVLGRSPKKGLDSRVRFVIWNPLEGPPPPRSLDDTDAIVHLAGEPVAQRWTPEVKRAIRDSRVIGSANLRLGLEALEKRPGVVVAASAVGYYGSRGDEMLTEASPPGSDWLAETSKEWEAATGAIRDLAVRVVQLRFGLVLGRHGGALAKMLPPFKLGLGGRIGSGQQWMSWIHVDDVVEMIVFALQHSGLEGPANATAPNPVRNAYFASTLGSVLDRPALLPAPALAVKILFGEMSQIVLGGQQALPAKAEKAGFRFRFPTLRPALEDLLR